MVAALAGFMPLPLETVESGCDNENHQRQLEVDVGKLDAALREELKLRPAHAEVVA